MFKLFKKLRFPLIVKVLVARKHENYKFCDQNSIQQIIIQIFENLPKINSNALWDSEHQKIYLSVLILLESVKLIHLNKLILKLL